MKKHKGPDFIGIGGHKCASSWLWNVLSQEKSVWVPPRKELHYFDRSSKYPSPSHLSESKLIKRIIGLDAANIRWKGILVKDFGITALHYDWKFHRKCLDNMRWYGRYYFNNYSHDWYSSLFEHNGDNIKACGEITPSYSLLSVNDLDQISQLYPDIKIIFIMRNPVDRAWSNVKHSIANKQGRNNNKTINKYSSDIEIIKFIESPDVEARGNYLEILERIESVFRADQVFLDFYDNVVEEPKVLLNRLSQFLALDDNAFEHIDLQSKFYMSEQRNIPTSISVYLAQKYLMDIELMAQKFPFPCDIWRRDALSILEGNCNHPLK